MLQRAETRREDPTLAARRAADSDYVRSLMGHSPGRVVLLIFLIWLQLVGAWAAALLGPWWASIPAFIVIAACQQAMLLWVHEGSHFNLFPSRWVNDLFIDAFVATPIGISVQSYRANHLAHHNYLGEEGDLDRWAFAFDVRGWRFARLMIEIFAGWYGLRMAWQKYIAGLVGGRKEGNLRPQPDRLLMVAAWNLGLLALCWYMGRWWLYFALWLYPVLTVSVLFNIIRSIAEHQPAHYSGRPEDLAAPPTVRTTLPPPWEKWALYQSNFNYHVEHHAFPFVPFFNLPKLHRHLKERGFYDANPDLLQVSAFAVFARAR